MENLDEIKALVLHYLRGIWKNRWIAIIIAWPILFVGVIAVDQIKDRYSAETKVYIDSTSILKPLLRGLAIQSDFEAIVRLMIGKLLSRPNLERAARLMDMDIDVKSPAGMEALILKIRSRVEISAKKRSGTYTITYSDENRDRAKRMVQTLLDIFIEDTLGKSTNQSDSAISFIDRQITKYDNLLREAEKRREEFKRKNVGVMPKDGANYYSRYQETGNRLEQAKLSLAESTQRHGKIKFQLDNLKASNLAKELNRPDTVKSSLDERVDEQEVKLQDLLLLYTNQHPDVINAELVLKMLKVRRDKELKELTDNRKTNGPDTNNPLYQELLILLTQTEADISSYKTRVVSLDKKQEELKELVDVVPQIEAELQRLNRDYEIHKKNYSEFVERREQARISEDVESGTEQVKFRVIEPPFVSQRPVYPNRPLFDIGVLIVALGIGYGVGLLISLFQPVFYNQTDLGALGRAVLGTVSKFDTIEVLAKRRQNLIMFILANALFITVGIALIFVHSKGILILSALQLKVMAL
jgi:polysaccharide chain length determinant protein (PEP-CTERM system associated)